MSTKIELTYVDGSPARTVTITHADKVRADLAASHRGWPSASIVPTSLVTLAAHLSERRHHPETTPADFDTWLDSLDEFKFVEDVEADPTPADLP